MTDSAPNETIVDKVVTPKLWAGKYKTPEEMEEAIKAKDNEYGKLYSEHGETKKALEEKTKVPEQYHPPADVTLRSSDLAEIQEIAKNAGLTQDQFEKTARDMHSRMQSTLNAIEQQKKDIGADKLAIITAHIQKNYPESVRDAVLNQVIRDKNAMADILKERDQKLNSEVPGMDKGSQGVPQKYDGEKELVEAHKEYHKNPSERTRKRYIELARQVGEERYKDKIDRR